MSICRWQGASAPPSDGLPRCRDKGLQEFHRFAATAAKNPESRYNRDVFVVTLDSRRL
jgi:hypothetical protein